MNSHPKGAASGAQVYCYDDEESFPQSPVELKTNLTYVNTEHFVPLNLYQDSCSLKLSTLPQHHRNVLENLQRKIGYQINYFSPASETELNEVKLICRICCETLDVAKAEAHIFDQKHLRNLVERRNNNTPAVTVTSKETMYNMKLEGAQKNINNAKASLVPLSSAQEELKNMLIATTESLNGSSKKLVQNLTSKLKDYMNYFEPYGAGGYKSFFFCKMCRTSFPSKNARLHIYTNAHLHHLRKSLSLANLEACDAKNKTFVKGLVNKFNISLYFFQLIFDSELYELYFICKVCTVVLTPECLKSHIDSAEHSKNVQEDPVVLSFDSLNKYNKVIVQELTDAIKVRRIKDFSFVYRIGTEELRLYCKCCQLTLIPEKVEAHVMSMKHYTGVLQSNSKRQVFEDDTAINAKELLKTGPQRTQVTPSPAETERQNLASVGFDSSNPTTVSKNSFQSYKLKDGLDSERVNYETEKYMNPVSLSAGVRSTPASSSVNEIMPDFNFQSSESSIKENSREHSSNKRLRSDLNRVTASNRKTCFVCQDCNTVIRFETNIFHKELVDELFINCCGKSAETVIPTAKNCKVFETNYLNCETTPPATTNICDFELKGIHLPPSPTVSNANSSELTSRVSNDFNKEILKMLIDKIGVKISDFDFVFKTNSNELRFKCKFCSVMMRPESAEDHVKFESHVKYSQLSNLSNLDFESLNDNNKKIIRKLSNKIGSQINDFNVVVSLGFVCKICGTYVKAKTVADHMESEEHLKYLSNLGGHNDTAAGLCDAPLNTRKNEETSSSYIAHHSAPVDPCCCIIL